MAHSLIGVTAPRIFYTVPQGNLNLNVTLDLVDGTLTTITPLNPGATIRLLQPVIGKGDLRKTRPGTLLIENSITNHPSPLLSRILMLEGGTGSGEIGGRLLTTVG